MPNIIEPPELKRGTCTTCGNTDTVVAEGPNGVALCVDCVDCFAAAATTNALSSFFGRETKRQMERELRKGLKR